MHKVLKFIVFTCKNISLNKYSFILDSSNDIPTTKLADVIDEGVKEKLMVEVLTKGKSRKLEL